MAHVPTIQLPGHASQQSRHTRLGLEEILHPAGTGPTPEIKIRTTETAIPSQHPSENQGARTIGIAELGLAGIVAAAILGIVAIL
jgi:hypothetical protein